MESAAAINHSNVVTLARSDIDKHKHSYSEDDFIGFYGGDLKDLSGYIYGATHYYKLEMPSKILNKTDLLDLYSDEGQRYIAMLFGEESNEHSTELPAKKAKFVNNETIKKVKHSFKKGVSEGSFLGEEGKYTRISDDATVDIDVFQALKKLLG